VNERERERESAFVTIHFFLNKAKVVGTVERRKKEAVAEFRCVQTVLVNNYI
jgi:hypothetical protein